MNKYLGRFSGEIYAILRIVVGFLFFCHGAQKMLGWWQDPAHPMLMTRWSLVWWSGLLELLLGLLVMTGLFASWAAFVASGEMAVAYFKAHFARQAFWPIQNHGEAAVLYCFIFLYIASRGAGKWSIAAATKQPALE